MDYSTIAPDAIITKTADALASHGFTPHIVADRAEALALIQSLVPEGASVQNGASRTLEEIGFVEYLKSGAHGWNNLHEAIVAEKDPAKQAALRKQATISDVYLGSVHAVTEGGEFLVASNTGSQLPNIAFNSPTVVLVVGAQKIVPDVVAAFDRLQTHVLPLEHENMQQKYGMPTQLSEALLVYKASPITGRTFHVILVKEKLGF